MSWAIAIAIAAVVVLAGAGFVMRARRFVRATPAVEGVVVDTPVNDTTVNPDGACRSRQSATITLPPDVLMELWTPVMLERLGRTYWAFMSTFSCHLLRIFYDGEQRSVSLFFKPLVMLGFSAPTYETEDGWGRIRWPITHGLLVARRGKRDQTGYLEIEVRQLEELEDDHTRVHIEVEVTSYYPLFNRISPWLYSNTQSRIHVLLAYGFLRRVVNRDLEESVAGRFAS